MSEKKHALVITAYQDISYLIELLNIYSQYFKCYVHVDKKTKITEEQEKEIQKISDVIMCQKYKINWGSYKHILAVCDLLDLALKDGCMTYSIISANTVPIKHPDKICDFFENNKEALYMEVIKKGDLDNQRDYRAFDYRYKAYYFQHLYNLRSTNKIYKKIINYKTEERMSLLQRKFNIRKGVGFNYKGYIYCHISKEAVQYVLDYVKEHPEYINKLKYCYVGEEFFFQNVIMESHLQGKVVAKTLIYDIWSKERGYPANLELTDLDALKNSECLFARKISSGNKSVFEKIRELEKF